MVYDYILTCTGYVTGVIGVILAIVNLNVKCFTSTSLKWASKIARGQKGFEFCRKYFNGQAIFRYGMHIRTYMHVDQLQEELV